MSYHDHLAADIRLIILRALADMPDLQLNSSILTSILDDFGHRITSAELLEQLHWLSGDEANAVSVIERGSIHVAKLTKVGLEHVDRRRVIEGVKQPSPEF